MIEKLKLSNFRLFDDEVTVRFRPITILIGKNNAGKSSIIKFLMMLKQSVGSAGFLVTNGQQVNLGRFNGLKNKKSKKRSLTFSLEVGDNGSPSDRLHKYLIEKEISSMKRSYKAQATINYNEKNQFLGKEQKTIFLAGDKKIMEKSSKISPNSVFLNFEGTKAEEPSVDGNIRDLIERACIDNLQSDIQGLQYLSAMREELKGVIETDSHPSTRYVGNTGKDTIFELWQEDILAQKDKKEFLIKHTNQVLGIDEIKFSERDSLAKCNARNTKTKARINISNFGFGVSQCLPIFVQGLLMPPKSQLIVEQPEAQVHPTAQIEMGSFFVELWKQYQVGSIIETHSDNILLRLRRLITKGEISKKDVSVAFFDFDADVKNPTIKNLDIQEDGSMNPSLSMEFFGADILEGLKLGAKE